MERFVCATCGTQFPGSAQPPESCPTCEDERQFVGFGGQAWTTLAELRSSHHTVIEEMEPKLHRIGMRPDFGIGQHAHLLESLSGNVLWDCITLIDDEAVSAIEARGGLSAIAISHPHYYSTMLEWSRAFGSIPIYLHEADRQWVVRPGAEIEFWAGNRLGLHDDLTLIRGGGHFEGGTMLHWPAGADGRGVLMAGDIIQVVHDRAWVSFMWSYVNYIPLSAAEVRGVAASIEPYDFERIYSPWAGRVIDHDGKAVVRRSAERYVRALDGRHSG